jgi:hypothetical protein
MSYFHLRFLYVILPLAWNSLSFRIKLLRDYLDLKDMKQQKLGISFILWLTNDAFWIKRECSLTPYAVMRKTKDILVPMHAMKAYGKVAV